MQEENEGLLGVEERDGAKLPEESSIDFRLDLGGCGKCVGGEFGLLGSGRFS